VIKTIILIYNIYYFNKKEEYKCFIICKISNIILLIFIYDIINDIIIKKIIKKIYDNIYELDGTYSYKNKDYKIYIF